MTSFVFGTDVDPDTRNDIIQLDLEQNDANSIGDSEGMIDRMLADDTLWVGGTGRLVTKAQILEVTEETARWRVFKAWQKLMESLEPQPDNEKSHEV